MKPPKVRALALTLVALGLFCPSLANAQVQRFLKAEPGKGAGKLGLLYRSSGLYLLGGTMLDMSSTVRALNHPTLALKADGSVLTRYYSIETGWAGCFGRRNTGAVVMANVALNVGINLLSRNLYRRGGRWRVLAIGVNVLKGTDNLMAGIHNVRYSAGVDGRLRMTTGYSGPISWSH